MPGETFDKLGEVSGYALELGDSVKSIQLTLSNEPAYGFQIERNRSLVYVYGVRGERTFTVEYQFRISNQLPVTEDEMRRYADDSTAVDLEQEQLENAIKKQKLEKIEEEAVEDAVESALSETAQTKTAAEPLYFNNGSDLLDGFIMKSRLYPFSSNFGIKDYNDTVRQIISDGVPAAREVYNSLDELGEDQAPELNETEQRRPDRTYQ